MWKSNKELINFEAVEAQKRGKNPVVGGRKEKSSYVGLCQWRGKVEAERERDGEKKMRIINIAREEEKRERRKKHPQENFPTKFSRCDCCL